MFNAWAKIMEKEIKNHSLNRYSITAKICSTSSIYAQRILDQYQNWNFLAKNLPEFGYIKFISQICTLYGVILDS